MKKIISTSIFLILVSSFYALPVHAETWGLVLKKGGKGSGIVCVSYDGRDDCQIDDAGNETNVIIGDYVFLRATPTPGSYFVKWVGDCKGTHQTCQMLARKPSKKRPIMAGAVFSNKPPAHKTNAPLKEPETNQSPSYSKPSKSHKKGKNKKKTSAH